MSTDHAPTAPPAALPPIPDGHPHEAALNTLRADLGASREWMRAHPDDHPDFAGVASHRASTLASFFALLASPSVVADAGAGDDRRSYAELTTHAGTVYHRIKDDWYCYGVVGRQLRDAEPGPIARILDGWATTAFEVARLTSARDAATRRADAAERALEAERARNVVWSCCDHTAAQHDDYGCAASNCECMRVAPSRAVPTEDQA